MLRRIVMLLLVTLTLGTTLAACDAPDVDDAEVEVDD